MGRGRTEFQGDDYEQDDDLYNEYDDAYEDRRRRPVRASRSPRRRRRRRRSIWPLLLGGCALGVLCTVFAAAAIVFVTYRAAQGGGAPGIVNLTGQSTTQPFTQDTTQQVSLSGLTQVQVCDKIGNVSLKVDPGVSTATVTTEKIVHMTSKTAANQEFGRIAVEVQPPGTITKTLTCTQQQAAATTSTTSTLTINTSIPDSSGLMPGTGDAVNIAITLPPGVFANAASPLHLDIEAPLGNVTVDGVTGVLTIKGSSGNVSLTNAILIDGSHIETGQGNITFSGRLAIPSDTTTQANYNFSSEQGTLDVTLPSTTNVILSANTNAGTVHSDFPINVSSSGNGPANYHGPLNSSAPIQSTSLLTLDVGIGNVNIHRA